MSEVHMTKHDLDDLATRLEDEARRLRIMLADSTLSKMQHDANDTTLIYKHVMVAIDATVEQWRTCMQHNPPPMIGWEYDQAMYAQWLRVRDLVEKELQP